MKNITPYNSKKSKKTQIGSMFNRIATTYDLLNRILSFGMDQFWRKKAIQKINNKPNKILDIATGTADLAIIAAHNTDAKIIGVDISEEMLKKGDEKIKKKKINTTNFSKIS